MGIKSILSTIFVITSNVCALNLRSIGANTNYFNNSVSSIDSLTNVPINCTNVNYVSPECGYRGICLVNGACKCDEGYATFPRNHPTQCNYEKKSLATMFWLSLLFGQFSGAGFWYIGYKEMAIAQLIMSIFAILTGLPFRQIQKELKDGSESSSDLQKPFLAWGCCSCMLSIIALSLWITSIVSTLLHHYTDENDVVLADW